MGRPIIGGAPAIVSFSVVFAIGVAEGPKTIPDDVKFPPLGTAVPNVLPELATEVASGLLGRVDVAEGPPDESPPWVSEMAGELELELSIGVVVDVARSVLGLPACRPSITLFSAPASRVLSERRPRNNAESSASALMFPASRNLG